jgi:hypothetical protein
MGRRVIAKPSRAADSKQATQPFAMRDRINLKQLGLAPRFIVSAGRPALPAPTGRPQLTPEMGPFLWFALSQLVTGLDAVQRGLIER